MGVNINRFSHIYMGSILSPDKIMTISKYAFKMLQYIDENATEITIFGPTLYAYYCIHPELAQPETPTLDYKTYKDFHDTIQNSHKLPDEELSDEIKKIKRTAFEFSVYFEELVAANQMPNFSEYIIVDLVKFKQLENFYLYEIWCKTIIHIPQTLKCLSCVSCGITKLSKMPKILELLNCNYNKLRFLPPLYFTKLEVLLCDFNQLTHIPVLPKSVKCFSCNDNILNELSGPLPHCLEHFSCYNNNLTKLPTIPPTLIGLYVSRNFIKTIPKLPKTLIYLFFDHNEVSEMPELPVFLKKIVCNKNPLKQYIPFPPSVCYANIDGTVMTLHNETNIPM